MQQLYRPFKSSAKHKKYSVYVLRDGRKHLLHFGDTRYEHYHDRLGEYPHLDHFDERRRRAYHSRHGPATDPNTAKWWSHAILW